MFMMLFDFVGFVYYADCEVSNTPDRVCSVLIAIARDDKGYQPGRSMPVLDINQPEQIADFICTTLLKENAHD